MDKSDYSDQGSTVSKNKKVSHYHDLEDMCMLLKRVDQCFSSLERNRSLRSWEDLAEFISPNQSGMFLTTGGLGPMEGTKKTCRLYDSMATQYARDFASAIHGTMTNDATKWSVIKHEDPKLNENKLAVEWLDAVNDRIHQKISDSNFAVEVAKFYLSYVTFGNGAMLLEEDDREEGGAFTGFRFKALHIAETAWKENSKGEIDCLYRKFKLKACQLMEMFPDLNSVKVQSALEDDPEQQFVVVHVICPRDPAKVKTNSVGLSRPEEREFASVYVLECDKIKLEESGYYEFPVFVVRFDCMPGEEYGRGPGHVALPDIKTLNTLKKHNLKSVARAADPNWVVRNRGVLGSLNIAPGGVIVVNDMNDITQMPSVAKFDVTQITVEDLRNSIRSIFYIDKLMLPPRTETGEMSAFEIARRIEEMQKVLGPTVARINNQFLKPSVVREFKMLFRAGQLPEMPPILRQQGVSVNIEFVNQLARAQRIEDVVNIQNFLKMLGLMSQLDPNVIDICKFDEAAFISGRTLGVPEPVLREEGELQQVRQQKQKMAQAQMALQAGQQLADISSKTAGTTNPSGSTV